MRRTSKIVDLCIAEVLCAGTLTAHRSKTEETSSAVTLNRSETYPFRC